MVNSNELTRKYHDVANIFPLMQGDELEALKADIRGNGQLEPIWLHPDGSIIDGRNRHRACIETDTQPKFKTWDGKGSLVSFVVSLNLHRRHLSSSQKSVVSLNVEKEIAKEIAKEKEEKGRAAALLQQNPSLNEIEKERVCLILDKPSRSASQEAADIVGVSRAYVQEAKRIEKEAPDLIQKIERGEMTIPQAKREIARAERIEKIQEISKGNGVLDSEMGLFPVVYADPPWRYEHYKTESRMIENQYPTMSLEEICGLPLCQITTPDSILYLWATAPKLEEAMRVIASWGFVYRTCMVWDKEKIGMGYYARGQHELLLIATKGSMPVPEPSTRVSSVYREARGEHSEKPEYFRHMIEQHYPTLKRIELFARVKREGWQAWGNQV